MIGEPGSHLHAERDDRDGDDIVNEVDGRQGEEGHRGVDCQQDEHVGDETHPQCRKPDRLAREVTEENGHEMNAEQDAE